MATFTITGRMSAKTVKKNFAESFGGTLRILKNGKPVDDGATMASLKAEGCKGGKLELKGNTKVAGMKKKVADLYGIDVQVYDANDKKPVDDGLTLASIGTPQSAAPAEKPVSKKEPKGKPVKETKEKAAKEPKAAPTPYAAPAPKQAQAPAQPASQGFSFDQLLDAALADGMVTDKERAILIKKATAQGYNPDEVEMMIDGRLAQLKQVQSKATEPSKQEEQKTGKPTSGDFFDDIKRKCDELLSNQIFKQSLDESKKDFQIIEDAWKQYKLGDEKQAVKVLQEYAISKTRHLELSYYALYCIFKENGKYKDARKWGLLFYQSEYSEGIPERVVRGSGLESFQHDSRIFKIDFSEMLTEMCESLFRAKRKNEAIRFYKENKKYISGAEQRILELTYSI